jgi:hypothetical protein
LGNLGLGLKVQGKNLQHRNGVLEKSCTDLQTTSSKDLNNYRKMGVTHLWESWKITSSNGEDT